MLCQHGARIEKWSNACIVLDPRPAGLVYESPEAGEARPLARRTAADAAMRRDVLRGADYEC